MADELVGAKSYLCPFSRTETAPEVALLVVPPLTDTSGLPGMPTIVAGAATTLVTLESSVEFFAELSVRPNDDISEEAIEIIVGIAPT